jgi:hypothetical protein
MLGYSFNFKFKIVANYKFLEIFLKKEAKNWWFNIGYLTNFLIFWVPLVKDPYIWPLTTSILFFGKEELGSQFIYMWNQNQNYTW